MATPLTAEILVDMPLPADAQISPDGSLVALSVAPASKRDEHPTSAIWLAATDGNTQARQISGGLANDTKPRWSPDGREIAFLSDRIKRGAAQVFVLTLDGGEAHACTDEPGGVSDLCWLPGKERRLAFLAVKARDPEEQRRRDEERDDADVYGQFWPFARVSIKNLDTGETIRFECDGKHVASLSPSPDGSQLSITLWDTPEIDNVMANSQLAVMDVSGGEIRAVGNRGFNADNITWGRDGRSLYFFGRGGEFNVTSYQMWTVDLDADDGPECLTSGFPGCVYGVAGGRDSDDVYALVAEGTESAIYTYHPADGSFEKLSHFNGDLSGITSSCDGSTIATIGSVADRPGDVFAGRPPEDLGRVTDFHSALDDVQLGHQEIVNWDRNGTNLDGILIWPHGKSLADGPMPTIVSLHGGPYGRWANSFITRPFGRWLASLGYLVFLPNPRGGMGHGQAFAESVRNSVGDEDYLDIIAGVDMLVDRGLADPDRLGCGGWSQGGFMTAWIVGHTDRFKAGVMGAGVSDWGMMVATSDIPTYEAEMGGGNPYESAGPHSFDRQSPISFVHNATTPTLILHGEKDARVPVSQGIFFHRGLRAYDVPTELVIYPREPHGIQERNHQLDMLRRVATWFQRWLPVDRS